MDASTAEALRVRLLGGFEISAAGQPVALVGRKLQALVACLALSPGTAWSREKLMNFLWGDRGDDQARASLRQALSRLRHQVGTAAALRTEHDSVCLDPALTWVDAGEFEQLARSGELAAAAALYRGELLEGHRGLDGPFADWLLVERAALHDRAVQVLSRLVQTQTGESAIETAQRLLQLEPDREETHRTLMRLYVGQGERAKALRQYLACRDSLRREFGVEPEPETRQLFDALRASMTNAVAHVARQPASMPSLGGTATAELKTVLWVDDRPDNNIHEREIIEFFGIRLLLSPSTAHALHTIARLPIDAIISDMGRPPDARAGYTLLSEVRARQLQMPFFIYAGSREPEHIKETLERGAQGTTNRALELLDMLLASLNLKPALSTDAGT